MKSCDHGHDQGHSMTMEPVSKSALKAKMLEYLRRVEETGEELIVTDNNVPVVRIVPFRKRMSMDELFADVRGGLIEHEDVLTPTTDEWPET
jgi:prevent-host-death family protein